MNKGILYGIFMAIALIAYFLIMKLFGLEGNFYLRIFNFVILIAGVYFLLRSELIKSDKKIGYFGGLGLGLRATITAVVLFIVFMAAYVKLFDPGFVEVLEKSQIWGTDITLSQAAVGIVIEGIASAIVISFAWMQYFKKYTSKTTEVPS